jgi:hypothetical protein
MACSAWFSAGFACSMLVCCSAGRTTFKVLRTRSIRCWDCTSRRRAAVLLALFRRREKREKMD